jgi:glycosyltransferase involved in cell wall biosynthesis
VKIDILSPTRNRVQSLDEMLASIWATADVPEDITAYIYVDDDDPHTREAILDLRKKHPQTRFVVGPRLRISGDWWNKTWEVSSGKIIMQAGDDILFTGPGWDRQVRDAFEAYPDQILLVYGPDGIQDEKLGTHSFVSRKSTEVIGTFLPRYFPHLFNDTWLNEVYAALGRRLYVPEVRIEHRHFSKYPERWDETYADRRKEKATQAQKMWYETVSIRHEWMMKLRGAMR